MVVSEMLTIRKKLEEQAATGGKKSVGTSGGETQLSRKLSFRSQLLSAEANELGGVLPSQCSLCSYLGVQSCIFFVLETCQIKFENPDRLSSFEVVITPSEFISCMPSHACLVILYVQWILYNLGSSAGRGSLKPNWKANPGGS